MQSAIISADALAGKIDRLGHQQSASAAPAMICQDKPPGGATPIKLCKGD
ncbi:hypothetical protein [Oceanicaulis sp.]